VCDRHGHPEILAEPRADARHDSPPGPFSLFAVWQFVPRKVWFGPAVLFVEPGLPVSRPRLKLADRTATLGLRDRYGVAARVRASRA
jgi:hypothetical protein